MILYFQVLTITSLATTTWPDDISKVMLTSDFPVHVHASKI